jgi:Tfp pilus assembly protein PilV
MGKVRNNQAGFSAVEVLLTLIFVAIIAFIGIYVAHNRNSKSTTTASTKKSTASTIAEPKTHTVQEATDFTQTTYDDFLTAINNAGTDNTQPLGQVGLKAVEDNLTADFYAKATASPNAGDFSCAAQFVPSKYTASLTSSNKTTATVSVAIGIDDQGGDSSSGPLTATVDLASLKITAVTCPN